MKISIVSADITTVRAAAICTSTNPRLSLMMGTGGAVREKGGFEVLRACEAILAEHESRTGRRELPAGSAHLTTAGGLPYRGVIHCVASGAAHRSSPDIVRTAVERALEIADAEGFETLAMPVFATGHAHLRFDRALAAMHDALSTSDSQVDVILVVEDPDHVPLVRDAFE